MKKTSILRNIYILLIAIAFCAIVLQGSISVTAPPSDPPKDIIESIILEPQDQITFDVGTSVELSSINSYNILCTSGI